MRQLAVILEHTEGWLQGAEPVPICFFVLFFFCFPLPDVWSVISNAGGMGTTGSPQVLLPKLICIWDGYLPANSPSIR